MATNRLRIDRNSKILIFFDCQYFWQSVKKCLQFDRWLQLTVNHQQKRASNWVSCGLVVYFLNHWIPWLSLFKSRPSVKKYVQRRSKINRKYYKLQTKRPLFSLSHTHSSHIRTISKNNLSHKSNLTCSHVLNDKLLLLVCPTTYWAIYKLSGAAFCGA